jgi:hypothetical protein
MQGPDRGEPAEGNPTTVLWLHGPHGLFDHSRLPRERRHEPFTPRLPAFLMAHPTTCGIVLAGGGIGGTWAVVGGMPGWPDWAVMPGAILGILCMLAMMIGLGIVVVRLLEPVLGMMELDWNAEPLSALGIPFALQRKCERLGYWSAEDLTRSVERGTFPWTEIAFDERLQIERSAQLWKTGRERAAQDRRPLATAGRKRGRGHDA